VDCLFAFVVYRFPYLYILHFNCIAVVKLEPESYTHPNFVPDMRFITFRNPQFLGTGIKSTSIIVSSSEGPKMEKVGCVFLLYIC